MSSLSPTAMMLAVIIAASLAGCANTVHGVATDVKQTGNAVEQAVK